MTLRLGNVSDQERFVAWGAAISRIKQEHVGLGWSHYIFRLLREIFNRNESLRKEGGFLLASIAEMYVTHALMTFRRDVDKQAGTESLINLLSDIEEHAPVLTRGRFLSTWNTALLDYAEEQFEAWEPLKGAAGRGTDHINPAIVRQDREGLMQSVVKVREYAERTKAHRGRAFDAEADLTYNDMHDSIRSLRRLVNRYSALLTASATAWEPVPQFSPVAPFKYAWLPDDPKIIRQVLDAVDKESVDDV